MSKSSASSQERFYGELQKSQKGTREVITYTIPGSRMAYVFPHHRRNADHVVFACRGCKRERHHLTVKVVGNEILNDPCEGHVCTPVNTSQDRANRLMYKTCQKVRSDPLFASKSVPEIWEQTLQQAMTGRRGSGELVAYFYKYSLESRRRTIESYIRSTASLYPNMNRVQQELQAAGATDPSRIILDFEISALKAAERCFPNTSVEGCLFHLSQCWNRRRNALGITKFLKGPHRSAFVKKWWRTIKGIPFLPERFLSRLPALFRPSMPDTHPAFECCEAFLVYLYDTRLSEPLRRYWCKWRMDLKNNQSCRMLPQQNSTSTWPKTRELPKCSGTHQARKRKCVAKLVTFDQFDIGRHVRRKYSLRNEKISRKMESFERQVQGVVTTSALIRYCRAMLRFVSEKAI
ncbi:unnamed protein product [Cylicocyclus nassatus]|uniref:MULE transposase domain-containing protein n=1 Tax=Cylicocyclus nassatus TaxID=53992 RepID=A0AA36GPA9_CYLNA|nr:unnamed protein product [Cylicocyclus nassatus]